MYTFCRAAFKEWVVFIMGRRIDSFFSRPVVDRWSTRPCYMENLNYLFYDRNSS